MNQMADQGQFIAAYPEGASWLETPWRSWNAGQCCGYAMHRGVDDVEFIRRLIDELIARHAVDPQRVYVTGVSNGGMMAHRLGCELSDRIAAIAPIAGSLGVACHPTSPVSVMIVHGTNDRHVPYEDGTILRQTYTGGQEGAEVMVSTIRGGRHVWPHRELSATELIWEFFARHSRNTTPRQAIRRGVTPTKEATAS